MHGYQTIKIYPGNLVFLLSKIMLLNIVKKALKGPVKIFLVNQKFMWGI